MSTLTLASAAVIVDVALERGRAMHLKPLTVAVLDAGGHLVAFKREDSSGILRPQIAIGKAWGVLGMGVGGRDLAKRAETHPTFFAALSDASGGRVFPVPGGVLIRDERKEIVGSHRHFRMGHRTNGADESDEDGQGPSLIICGRGLAR